MMQKSIFPFRLCLLCILCSIIACKPVISYHPNIVNGGRIVALTVHPRTDQIVIAAAETGGLFRTNDQGKSWQHLGELPCFAMGDVKFSKSEGDVVLSTTMADTRTINGGGIWRSTNGGNTWSKPSSSLPPITTRHKKRTSAHGISFEPGTSTVIVGTDCGVAISKDLGANWKYVLPSPYWWVLEDSLQDRIVCVLARGGGNMNAAGPRGIFYSTDSGATWKSSTSGPYGISSGVNRFAVSPYNPNHVFLASDSPNEYKDTQGNVHKSYLAYLSVDGGVTWDTIKVPEEGYGRETFLRIAKSISGNPREFDLYYGTGFNTYRQTCSDNPNGPILTYKWTLLNTDHSDPSDVAFDINNTAPILLAGDGGIHTTKDKGTSWQMTGGGDKGLNALQITEVNGHQVAYKEATDENPDFHTDLYFGTQDNHIWASANGGTTWQYRTGGEGFYVQPEGRKLLVKDDAQIVFVSCADCDNRISGAYFDREKSWRNPVALYGNPFYLLKPGHYVQNELMTYYGFVKANTFYVTPSYGLTWTSRIVIPFSLAGRPYIAPSPAGPVVYQAISTGKSSGGMDTYGLIRIKNIEGPGPAVAYRADVMGFGSLGYFTTMFAWYVVYGVDPHNADHLIMADAETNQMKYTVDGGQCWHVDDALTKLVTDNGNLLFDDGVYFLQVHTIAFDPDHEGRIMVGTKQAGVMCSNNNGNSWEKIPKSEKITNASSIFYEFDQSAMVSSYGRGLWKIRLNKPKPPVNKEAPRDCGVLQYHDRILADKIKIDGLTDIPGCIGCHMLMVLNGEITDAAISADGILTGIMISAGSLVSYDTSFKAKEVLLPVQIKDQKGNFSNNPIALRIADSKETIRGIVVEKNVIKGMVTSDDVFPGYETLLMPDSITIPYLKIFGENAFAGLPSIKPGGDLTFDGINFFADQKTPVSIYIGQDTITTTLLPDSRGHFSITVPYTSNPGFYRAIVVQKTAGRDSILTAAAFNIRLQDSYEGKRE